MTLSESNNKFALTNTVQGPIKTVENTTKYLEFGTDGVVTGLSSAPQNPPYQTTDENPSLTLTFPDEFPSGNTPDEELGEGTELTVSVVASNTVGSSGPLSASVQPEGPSGPDLGPALNGLVKLYEGNGPNSQDIVNGINLIDNDGLIWIKNRESTQGFTLTDTLNGIPSQLDSSSNEAINTSTTSRVTSFNNNGFTVGESSYVNSSGKDIVAWTFQSTPAYFDCVKYDGDGVAGRAIPHQLTTTPGVMIVKRLNSDSSKWFVYHQSLGNSKHLVLNETGGEATSLAVWNNTDPTETEFTVGTTAGVNNSSGEYIAYLFADTPGVIKCGDYTGTGAAGNVVECGFKPQWVLIKQADASAASNWYIYDSKRSGQLQPNVTTAEGASKPIDFTDNGFELTNGSAGINAAGRTIVYVAIAAPPAARSLTQEEFAEQGLRFATYDNRQDVVQGQKAMSRRDDLMQELRQAGVSQEQIDKLMG